MRLSATKLRQNLYNILDEVLEKGIPVEIERNGQVLKIITEKPRSKLANLEPHDTIVGDPEDIVSIDWSKDWREDEKITKNYFKTVF